MKSIAHALLIGLVWLALPALAKPLGNATDTQRIVDTAAVQAAIERGAIVWDVRDIDAYLRGHIPGAVTIGEVGGALRKDGDEDYIDLNQMAGLLGSAGIDPGREVVVYGDKGSTYAYFGVITLEYLNGKNATVYHGGIDDWKAAGLPLSNTPTQPTPIALKLTVNPKVTVDTPYVRKAIKRKEVQIVDARTPDEYLGNDIRALRGGHIPGAISIPFEQNWADPDTPQKLAARKVQNKDGMSLKPKGQLKQLYAGLDPNKETIVYCQSGVRASETALVLKELGFKQVKVYDSSWLGYGNTLDAPAENVQYFNVGALNNLLGGLYRRVEFLERQLANMRPAASQ